VTVAKSARPYKPFGAAYHGLAGPPPPGQGANDIGLQEKPGTEEKKGKLDGYKGTVSGIIPPKQNSIEWGPWVSLLTRLLEVSGLELVRVYHCHVNSWLMYLIRGCHWWRSCPCYFLSTYTSYIHILPSFLLFSPADTGVFVPFPLVLHAIRRYLCIGSLSFIDYQDSYVTYYNRCRYLNFVVVRSQIYKDQFYRGLS